MSVLSRNYWLFPGVSSFFRQTPFLISCLIMILLFIIIIGYDALGPSNNNFMDSCLSDIPVHMRRPKGRSSAQTSNLDKPRIVPHKSWIRASRGTILGLSGFEVCA